MQVATERVGSRRASSCVRGPLQLGHALHQLGGRDVLDVAADGPAVAERINDESVAIAVELVLRRALERGAELHRVVYDRVDILDVDVHEYGGTHQAVGWWRLGAH